MSNFLGTVTPDRATFLKEASILKIPPVYKEIDYRPPAFYYECFGKTNSFILESIKGSHKIARYSYVGWQPCIVFKVKGSSIEVIKNGKSTNYKGKPLSILKNLVQSYSQKPFANLPSFQGGAVGFFSYDFLRFFEKIPSMAIDDLNLPEAHFFLIDRLIAFDHKEEKAWIIFCPAAREVLENNSLESLSLEDSYEKALELIDGSEAIIKSFSKSSTPYNTTFNSKKDIQINYPMSKTVYTDIVKKTLDYIKAGDIFQANLSQRLSANVKNIDPWSLYKKLSLINPSPFACFFDFDDYYIVSSSPERLVRGQTINKNGAPTIIADTRPIAGTRSRGKTLTDDERLRNELLLNDKERAEHIMLIDLERNDLGRVSNYGSVNVDELMITEDYSHVIHIVSNVVGELNPTKDCFSLLQAMFPGGTITGVPKVRCMEIIDELEPVRRGPYTGSAGYFSFSNNMDFNIIIRTFVIENGFAYVQAGAGIVADSKPEREYYETLKKAEALIKTLKEI